MGTAHAAHPKHSSSRDCTPMQSSNPTLGYYVEPAPRYTARLNCKVSQCSLRRVLNRFQDPDSYAPALRPRVADLGPAFLPRPMICWLLAWGARAYSGSRGPADPVPAASAAFAAPAALRPQRHRACWPATTCHGQGRPFTAEGTSPLHYGQACGLPAQNQLLNFRDGRRSYPQMGYSSST